MTPLEHALALAAKGFYVFPLRASAKLPAIDEFPLRATREESTIRAWWDGGFGVSSDHNIGIYTGRFGDAGESLCVVDVDTKDGKPGNETLETLKAAGVDFPATYTQLTPTGGRHLVYRTADRVGNSVGTINSGLGAGIDVRGVGGFIVAAGSRIGGAGYLADGKPVAVASPSLIARCTAYVEKERNVAPIEGIDQDRAVASAVAYLAKAKVAVEGDGGNATTFAVAARVKDFGVDADKTIELMLEHWNPRCQPPWDDDELQTIVDNAFSFGRNAPGSAAPEALFTAVDVPQATFSPDLFSGPSGGEVDDPVNALNKEHAMILVGNDYSVLWETDDAEGNTEVRLISTLSLRQMYSGHKVTLGAGTKSEKQVPIADMWLNSRAALTAPEDGSWWRRTYKGLWYMPEKPAPPGFYNAWRGFTFKPFPKDETPPEEWAWAVNAWREHILQNICQGKPELAKWLIGWFAHLVQKPYAKVLTAIVLRGEKGSGKTSPVQRVADLFGVHAVTTANVRFLIGQFNSHLERLSLLTLDEAVWAGAKDGQEGILKHLITGDKHRIERKGKESYDVPNLTRVVIITNEGWAVPATPGERRYAVFDVGNGRRLDKPFFDRMARGIRGGGGALLLRYLMDFDISDFDGASAPETAGLDNQKRLSLTNVLQFWYQCLVDGGIVGLHHTEHTWPAYVVKRDMGLALKSYFNTRNIKKQVPSAQEVRLEITSMCPSFSDGRAPRDGNNGSQPAAYKLPPLAQARAEWDAAMGFKEDWK